MMTQEERQIVARLLDYSASIALWAKEALAKDEFTIRAMTMAMSLGIEYDPKTSAQATECIIEHANESLNELKQLIENPA